MTRLLVCAHDAGGAEILSSWLRLERPEGTWTFLLRGPAESIFRRKLGPHLPEGTVEEADLVVSGTGAGSFERRVISGARRVGTRVTAWLDHWTRYAERFDELPDEVWTADRVAYDLARAVLPGVTVFLRENPYLTEILDEIRSHEQAQPNAQAHERVLFVCERDRSADLARFLSDRPPDQEVRVRPHPAMADPGSSLAEQIAWADTVVGCQSMALVVALKAGRRVFSVIPAEEPLTLPYQIERLGT